MQIVEFKITNFKSILNTGWRRFSTDNVTVLIGQNESGKTSILEAIAKTFSSQPVTDDDIRIDEPLPKVFLKILIENEDIDSIRQGFYEDERNFSEDSIEEAVDFFSNYSEAIEIMFQWYQDSDADGGYGKIISIVGQSAENLESFLMRSTKEERNVDEDADIDVELEVESKIITLQTFADVLYEVAPTINFFEHETGLLPSQIDIHSYNGERYSVKGKGAFAAENFLIVAGLDLNRLVECDMRTRQSLLSSANSRITRDFSMFWSQVIGRTDKLKLECDIQTYDSTAADKIGKQYLIFWVCDGVNKLYPKQRSQGVRWFVSFYLQLKASEIRSAKRFFLLDEPGANLHSRAQTDVINLINNLSREIPIVYSTHIPHMLEYDKYYRVLAVQRMGEEDDSPTEIKPAHELGTASTDTLSPVLAAMGVDISNQEVIKKNNNVLLEEMSGFYYLKSFWELIKEEQEVHFIAATGVNKLPNFANMFLGWGIEYIVVVDDDRSGRQVYNLLKRQMFSDDEELAARNMYKIRGCDGVEDVFSLNDFRIYVINDCDANVTTNNSSYMRDKRLSKPVHAYSFLLKVRSGEISLEMFDAETRIKITDLVGEIRSRLNNG